MTVQTYSDVVLDEFFRLVEDALEVEMDTVIRGVSLSDLAAYKERVGRIYAYNQMKELYREAENNVSKRT
jgi:hypothetical protein